MPDTITHILIGYSLFIGFKQFYKSAYKFFIPFIIGIVIPDLDYIFNLFGVTIEWIRHRGMSHSFIGAIIYVAIFGSIFLIPPIKKQFCPEISHWIIYVTMYIGTLFHILPDIIPFAEVMLFFPFSFEYVTFGMPNLYISNLVCISFIIISLVIFRKNILTDYKCYDIIEYLISIVSIVILLILSIYWYTTLDNGTRWLTLLTIMFSFITLGIILAINLDKVIKNEI